MSFAKLLKTDFLSIVENNGLEHVLKDRNKYKEIYKIVISYCKKRSCVLSNKYILTDKEDELENMLDKKFIIYSADPLVVANDLTNAIHKKMKKTDKKNQRYTRLKTMKEKEEFVIEYDLRQIAIIHKTQKHHGGEPISLINPVKINHVYYLPSEIEILDIYHTMYDAGRASERDCATCFEKILFKQVAKRYSTGKFLGAGQLYCGKTKRSLLDSIKISLIKKFLTKNDNLLLLGPWAYSWIKFGNNICRNMEKIQIIAELDIKDFNNLLVAYFRKTHNLQIIYHKQQLHIPNDFRINRYTFYVSIDTPRGTSKKPFLDFFNCANFEVIPYEKINSINVVSQYVMLRFLFIDLWILRVIYKMGSIDKKIVQEKIDNLWRLILFFRNEYKYPNRDAKFLGTYRDYLMDKKASALEGKRFFPYYPELYYEKNKKYRNF